MKIDSMIRFKSKFPFFSFKKKLSGKDYFEAVDTQTTSNNDFLIKNCRIKLSEHKIPLKKIKFVFEKSFTYDVDKNIINPPYKVMMPHNKKHPIIEIGKPENVMKVFLGENRTYDNYRILKQLASKSKRGIALLVDTENFDEVMWVANLDDAYEYYRGIENLDEMLNYNT